MTGGLQEQVTDGENWFGVGIEPTSKAVIGSQQVPYIYEDRISKEDFHAALDRIYAMSREERRELGLKGRQHVETNYSFQQYCEGWVDIMIKVYEEHGSWDTRNGYESWEIRELA